MSQKLIVSPDELRLYSLELGKKVLDFGYRPDLVVGLWRGAANITLIVHEQLRYRHGIDVESTMVETRGYHGDRIQKDILVNPHHIADVASRIKNGRNRLLLLDDVVDTGRTFKKVLTALNEALEGRSYESKIASVFYKPEANQSGIRPDFWVKETEQWINFPATLEGLSDDEIRKKGLDPSRI
ncbi:MAG TPA: phosphoribosyltransferase family protein [Candidatus Nanoarchaeia archaeon]|nr:phosphoribosyltransferase family protein [Candidatus Nanoarchaeia archaeon]